MSRRRGPVQAAGAVVLRTVDQRRQVLLVHRPGYDDLSLPKGKQEPGEQIPVTAVREVHEETGVRIRLGPSLQPVEYQVPRRGAKIVHWWLGIEISSAPRRPDSEVDQVKWVDVDRARRTMTYPTDVQVLEEALGLTTTSTVVLVRHGKAVSRKDWAARGKHKGKHADDTRRPLDLRGKRQARHLTELLEAYGIDRLVSSSSRRCVQTVEPYAQSHDLKVHTVSDLTEESHDKDADRPARAMSKLVSRALERPGEPVAVCGHRPVLPLMREALGGGSHPMSTAECLVVHLDAKGRPVRQEWHSSPA